MRNPVKTKAYFVGPKSKVNLVKGLIFENGDGSSSPSRINFSHVEALVPEDHDKALYRNLGYSEHEDVCGKYTPEQLKEFDALAQDYLVKNNFIGLRNDYINRSDTNVSLVDSYSGNGFLLRADFENSSPTLFFAKIAKDFNLVLEMVEYVNGCGTYLSYTDANDTFIKKKISTEALMSDKQLRQQALDLCLFSPAALVATAILSKNEELARELIKEHNVVANNIQSACKDIQHLIMNRAVNADPFLTSPYFGLEVYENGHFKEGEVLRTFEQLYSETKKASVSKKIK